MCSDLAVRMSTATMDALKAVYCEYPVTLESGRVDTVYGARIITDDTLPLYGWKVVVNENCALREPPEHRACREYAPGEMQAVMDAEFRAVYREGF